MRQQPITDESFSEAEAMRIVRGFSPAGRPRNTLRDSQDHSCRDVLARTFRDEVIPRLLTSRASCSTVAAAAEPAGPTLENVSTLTDLVMAGDQAQARDLVEAMQESGVSCESLLLNLLTPTAHRLGTMWEEDLCGFADVTIGLVGLAKVMRLVTGAFDGAVETGREGPRALLVQMPGEQHGLGLAMLAHFFRRAGWNIRREPVITSADLVGMVKAEWFSLVGLSVACDDRLDSLAADIKAIRRASRNPAVGVMVGGPPFIAYPQLAELVGADGTAADGRQAVQQAQCLVSLLARER